ELYEARITLSNLFAIKKEYAQAEEFLEQVLDEFPEHVGAMNDLGYLWIDQHKHLNRGLALIRRAIQAEPDNKAYLDSLGWAYYHLGQYQAAVEVLEKSAAGDDPGGVVLDHLADAQYRLGQVDKAR